MNELTIKEFAEQSGYTYRVIQKWIALGRLDSMYDARFNRRMIPLSEFERVQKDGPPGDKRRAENRNL